MEDNIVSFTGKRAEAVVADAARRVGAALPILLALPPESVRALETALATEIGQLFSDMVAGKSIDMVTPHQPEELREALREAIPQTYGTHDYYALYAAGMTLTRMMGALIEIGRDLKGSRW